MGKILVALLGFGALFGAAYHYLVNRPATDPSADTAPPPQRLQNVRNAAEGIEQDAQRRADELMNRTE